MKSELFFIALVALSSVLCGCAERSNEPVADSTATTAVAFKAAAAPTVEFSLPDMMCEEGCAVAVRDILREQPGAKDVRVDFDAKTATVAIEEGKFNSQLALAELVDKGFDNSQLKSDAPAEAQHSAPAGQ
ncbi:MAG TPA: heavy-metal-associated domain-containing protein [Lacipirellulaceae bacterium]